ncbi:hypothetical protein OSB04_006609 [Centaurea solstitialis]|uniref:Uncharacterized protein n=1 Tax=Centaurea solstitialis TaxID=347529 RepID=A0AA38TI98_9ASTR|nr:hypothetical protein OSB04_006609 [Centaurea solstitialis]
MYSRLIQEVPGAQPYCLGSSSQIKVSKGASKQEEKVESEAGANKEAKSFQASREVFRRVTNVVGIIPENDVHGAAFRPRRTMRVRCVPVRTDDRPVAFISMMIMEERIIIGRLQGCPRPEELCSSWNTVVGLTLSVHFVVIRVNFASEQLIDVIGREAISRHGGASDSFFRSGYPHHDCKTTLDSSEQTKSYADRRRSDLEFHVRKRVPLKISPWKEVICFRCEKTRAWTIGYRTRKSEPLTFSVNMERVQSGLRSQKLKCGRSIQSCLQIDFGDEILRKGEREIEKERDEERRMEKKSLEAWIIVTLVVLPVESVREKEENFGIPVRIAQPWEIGSFSFVNRRIVVKFGQRLHNSLFFNLTGGIEHRRLQ